MLKKFLLQYITVHYKRWMRWINYEEVPIKRIGFNWCIGIFTQRHWIELDGRIRHTGPRLLLYEIPLDCEIHWHAFREFDTSTSSSRLIDARAQQIGECLNAVWKHDTRERNVRYSNQLENKFRRGLINNKYEKKCRKRRPDDLMKLILNFDITISYKK